MFLTNILSWMLDPRNRTIILFIIIAGLIVLFLYQKNRTTNFKNKYNEQKKEKIRLINNYNASQDSLRTYIDKNGKLTAEKLGYQLTVEELNNENDSLFTLYKSEKDKKAKVHIEYVYKIVQNVSEIPTEIIGDTIIFVRDSINYGEGNYRSLTTEIPYNLIYRIKEDSVNSYELTKALKYSFILRQKGIKDAKVVSYRNNERVEYSDELNCMDSVVYHIQIYSSENNYDEKYIADKFNLDKDNIYIRYEEGIYYYMTGAFVPNLNVEPVVPYDKIPIYSQLKTGLASTKFNIGMKVGATLLKDPETQEITIRLTSKYPDIQFDDIRGAEIVSNLETNKKASRAFRKEFGIGLHLGLGAMPVANNNEWSMKWGPVISIGVNYTPRWLQFGENKVNGSSFNDLFN